jgi:4-hydroxythreonine-4-phosphate dehydrogenase
MTAAAHELPLIGITMGDPIGIGPEVVLKALSQESLYSVCRPLVLGDAAVLEKEKKALNAPLTINAVEDLRQAAYRFGTLDVLSLSRLNPDSLRYGHPDKETGTAMGAYIVRAAAMAMGGEIDAMVTGPINKKSLQEGGYDYPGHTEMLASLTSTQDVVMLLAGDKLRVALVTIHCALSRVPQLLSTEKILKIILITHDGLKNYFSLPAPRIAVASLNPHAGEEGMFGAEERDIIIPALQQARDLRVDVSGPYPADTLFYHAVKGSCDAVVCMYHDQGLIPLKLLHFENGVNITLGLPIIRTSVDHGTAYDIAGRGVANPASLIQAVTIAGRMAAARRSYSVS